MYPPFVPHPALRNPHLMTIGGYLISRRWRSGADAVQVERTFRMDADNQLLALCPWQTVDPAAAPTLALVHGLSGSASSGYMIGMADKAWALGFNVVRLNLRNCGGSEHLATSLYHSGMSEDLAEVLRQLRRDGFDRFHLAGFSMGGNIVLRLVGRFPDDLAPHVVKVAAVSPTLDLSRAVSDIDCVAINAVYRRSFLVHLRDLMRQKAKRFPGRFDLENLHRVRTIREFDERFTAKDFGFGDAETYYAQATALPLLETIRTPTLIVQSTDDPMVPAGQLRIEPIQTNPHIEPLVTERGGHCAFVSRRPYVGEDYQDRDRFWAENRLLQYFLASAPTS